MIPSLNFLSSRSFTKNIKQLPEKNIMNKKVFWLFEFQFLGLKSLFFIFEKKKREQKGQINGCSPPKNNVGWQDSVKSPFYPPLRVETHKNQPATGIEVTKKSRPNLERQRININKTMAPCNIFSNQSSAAQQRRIILWSIPLSR